MEKKNGKGGTHEIVECEGGKVREGMTKFGWKARLGEFCEVPPEESEERATIGGKIGSAKKLMLEGVMTARCHGNAFKTHEGLASTS